MIQYVYGLICAKMIKDKTFTQNGVVKGSNIYKTSIPVTEPTRTFVGVTDGVKRYMRERRPVE